MGDFAELLQEAEKITVDIEGTKELPKVDRSIRQVLEASNDLYTKVAQTGSKDIQANLLLGSKGVDLPKIIQKLESISTKRTFESIEPVEDVNTVGILENEIQNCILSVFETGFNKCMKTISDCSWEHQSGEWKQEKRKILNSMIGPSGAFIEVGKYPAIFMERPITIAPNLGVAETLYAAKIMEYNQAIGRSMQKPNLINGFVNVANELRDAKVKDMWEIIKYMTQLPPFPQSEDQIKTRNSAPVINALVKQGKKYLEDRYKTYMSNIINENLSSAMLGGVPGTYPLVRSFVGVRLQGEYSGLKDDKIDGRPLWPMVYYCIRSGDLAAAIYCLKKRSDKEFQDIIAILEAKLNNPDNPEIYKLEDNIRYNYRRHVRNETDPFKRIVCAVLGCCDVVDEHSEVARTADDYLWLKLSLVRADYDKDDHIKYADLQRMILEEYGETHYDAMNQPHLYFQVLALTGQFEAAIEFLPRTERYKVHAVHMAIALNELYLLAGSRDSTAPLISIDPMDVKPSRRLNLARLIMIYVHKFEITCPNEALHYFFFLRNFSNEDGMNLFKICVCDLVIETKEYNRILGTVQPNGIRSKGLIDQFTNAEITTESIAQMIGDNLIKKGLFEEAIEVFDIAGNQEEVLNLFCTLLSQVVHLPPQPNSLKERLQEKGNILGDRYSREGYKASSNVVTSYIKLKQLAIFFDQYHSKQFSLAMKTLNDLQIIPRQSQEVEERVKSFKKLNVDVCKVIPDVLLATMNMLFADYQKVKGNEYIPSRYQDNTMEKQLSHLREQAKILINFTGLLPYRMPGDTNSKLVQMEILMH
ncbi:nuclear pore complex protein Nup93 [Asbolus verrucosus]|uniref:Nuclear pore protein n=1 Tax=Asbolus verrucosus TaxID=1661398 RepID=A0A482VEM0_ASBVE|nr:nuclear pore complex protein Nup93 [Asbolus verrucosus]